MFPMRDFVEVVAHDRMADAMKRAEVHRLVKAAKGGTGSSTRRSLLAGFGRLALRRNNAWADAVLSDTVPVAAAVVPERRLQDRRCIPSTAERGVWGDERRCMQDRRSIGVMTTPLISRVGPVARPDGGAGRRRRRQRIKLRSS